MCYFDCFEWCSIYQIFRFKWDNCGKIVPFIERPTSRALSLSLVTILLVLTLANWPRLIAQVFAWLDKLHLDNKLLCLGVIGEPRHGCTRTTLEENYNKYYTYFYCEGKIEPLFRVKDFTHTPLLSRYAPLNLVILELSLPPKGKISFPPHFLSPSLSSSAWLCFLVVEFAKQNIRYSSLKDSCSLIYGWEQKCI